MDTAVEAITVSIAVDTDITTMAGIVVGIATTIAMGIA
jgi:hypothetical protein